MKIIFKIILAIITIITILILYSYYKYHFPGSDCEDSCGYKKPITIPIPKCKKFCNTTSSEENALESCSWRCGSRFFPTNAPLPNCRGNCFTKSNENDALKSCYHNCGIDNCLKCRKNDCFSCKKKSQEEMNKTMTKICERNCGGGWRVLNVPIPKCKNDCFTTFDSLDALKSCKVSCGSKESPANAPLPKCESFCYTKSKEKNALESCTKYCGKDCDTCTKKKNSDGNVL